LHKIQYSIGKEALSAAISAGKGSCVKEKLNDISEMFSAFLSEGGPELVKGGQQVAAGIFVLLLLISLLFQKGVALIATLLFFAAFVWYVLSRRAVEDEDGKKAKRWLCANLYLWATCVALTPYCLLSKALGASGGTVLAGLAIVLVADVGILCLQISETGKKVWDGLDDIIGAGAITKKKVLKPGDVVLCDNKDQKDAGVKDPREILPYKDRFLHMLILGPTGSGKTSQVILPMVCQDVHNLDAGVTVLEPKGDLAREVAMMAKELGRPYIYFDPSVDNCPFFNPLIGDETDVIENAVTTFLALNPDSPQFFKDLSEQCVRNTLKVLKRLDKDKGIDGYYSTFIWMSRILQNNGGKGRELVTQFSRIRSSNPDEAKENADIASWFLNEYFAERSKVYENSSGIRSQVSKVIANQYLRHILNPDVEKGEYNEIDFDKHLAEGGVICISTAQGLMRELGKFLGYFIILQFKSAVFRRPGNEDTRRAHWLYIDEFQQYSTPGFSEMLTQGRSYRVGCHLATQARAQMAMGGGRDGRNFVELVSTNARNVVIFPGGSADDAKYYSNQFGEFEKPEIIKSYTKKKFNLLTGGLDRLGHPSESIRIQSRLSPKFTLTDLIYKSFGEIVYCIIKNNTVQTPAVGCIKYLERDYDQRLKAMIEQEIVPHEVHPALSYTVPNTTVKVSGKSEAGGLTFEDIGGASPSAQPPNPLMPKPDESVSFTKNKVPDEQDAASAAAEEAAIHEAPAGFDDPWGEELMDDDQPDMDEGDMGDDLCGDPLDPSDDLI